MRVRAVKIVALCIVALNVSGWVYADSGLCNRFLAVTARLRGDSTAEFERRIGFLLDAGKIDETHLNRLLAADVPASPFDLATHVAADVLPHEKAIARLLASGSVEWSEVRRFAAELREKLNKGREQRVVVEKETRDVFYPIVLKRFEAAEWVDMPASYFEWQGSLYAAIADRSRLWGRRGPTNFSHLMVVDVAQGRIVQKILNPEPSAPIRIFERDGRPVALVGSNIGVFAAIDLMSGKDLWRTKPTYDKLFVGESPVFRSAKIGFWRRLFGGGQEQAYAVAVSGDGHLFVVNLETGKVARKMALNGSVSDFPVVYQAGGKSYAVVASNENRGSPVGYLSVIDLESGTIVHKIRVGGWVETAPAIIEKDGGVFGFARTADKAFVIVDLMSGKKVGEEESDLFKFKRPIFFADGEKTYAIWATSNGSVEMANVEELMKVNAFKIIGTGDLHSQVIAIEKNGKLVIAGSKDGGIQVVDVPTGKIRAFGKLPAAIRSISAISWNGRAYAIVGSADRSVRIIQLYGPLPREGKEE